MAPYEALYGRPYRSQTYWNEFKNKHHLGPNYIQETIDKVAIICKNLNTARSHQKSYGNNRRRALEFVVSDHVFPKIFPYKDKMLFENKGKMSRQFIGPFMILECIGIMAYHLALPPEFAGLHDIFHVFMLKRYTMILPYYSALGNSSSST